ncbi:GYF domain-containing protein [Planctomicrobium piriforme]|uniref:TM2 domain-containing membrane protein YozV n=1 Tax=Planctomicrobium piriforme TaxID=1576369 RepID=A0A1I3MYJ0_9PLAN|nr:GYF domain-containing protein [Planctomicrobium piriforme]SFJ02037.1 TM2 domain-containing membrane protein YozV [Planctomicrobium piriforme]
MPGSDVYFLKSAGKILGPLTWEQIGSLQARGRLKPDQQLSQDKKQWLPVDEFLNQLAPANEETNALPLAELEKWYYSDGSKQRGPVSRAALLALIDDGVVTGEHLVWKDSFAEWRPLSDVAELRAGGAPPPVPIREAARSSAQSSHSGFARQSFCPGCGLSLEPGSVACPRCGARQPGPVSLSHGMYAAPPGERKDKMVAALLALLLGGLGIHRFYLGNPALGLIYLLFCWTFIPAIISLFEAIFFLCMSTSEFDAHYNVRALI